MVDTIPEISEALFTPEKKGQNKKWQQKLVKVQALKKQ